MSVPHGWPRPRYQPAAGDQWAGSCSCGGGQPTQLMILQTWPLSDLSVDGRLAYIFVAQLAVGQPALNMYGAPTQHDMVTVGRYDPGGHRFEMLHHAGKGAQRFEHFVGAITADGDGVVGLVPSCGFARFELRRVNTQPAKRVDPGHAGTAPDTGAVVAADLRQAGVAASCDSPKCAPKCSTTAKGSPKQGSEAKPTKACLAQLWVIAGCSNDGLYAPMKAPASQVAFWQRKTVSEAWRDMVQYAKYAAQHKPKYERYCFNTPAGVDRLAGHLGHLGSIRSPLAAATTRPLARGAPVAGFSAPVSQQAWAKAFDRADISNQLNKYQRLLSRRANETVSAIVAAANSRLIYSGHTARTEAGFNAAEAIRWHPANQAWRAPLASKLGGAFAADVRSRALDILKAFERSYTQRLS